MNKKFVLLILNIFFIAVFIYTLFILMMPKNKPFNAELLLKKSIFKEKIFETSIEEITSDLGIKAWFMQEKSAPLVVFDFYFDKAGYAFEKENKEGVALLLSTMLERGAGKYSEEDYYNALELNAILIDFDVSDDVFQISLMAPSANIDVAAEILESMLTSPHFNLEDLKVSQLQQIEALKIQQESPQKILSKTFRKKLYLNHPKARDSLGNMESVSQLSRQDLKDFMTEHFTKDKLVVAVVGDISEQKAKIFLDSVFGKLAPSYEVNNLPTLKADYRFDNENIERDIPQVISAFAAPGTDRLSEDFYPLYIANKIFAGAGLTSRFNLAAREKEGLTYGGYAYLDTTEDAPTIQGGFSTSKENYEKVRQILFVEWQKMAKFGVSKEEFEDMKSHMLTSFNLRFLSSSDIAEQLLYMQKENLGIDFLQKRNQYVQEVTLDEVNKAAKKYFSTKPSILTIGNN